MLRKRGTSDGVPHELAARRRPRRRRRLVAAAACAAAAAGTLVPLSGSATGAVPAASAASAASAANGGAGSGASAARTTGELDFTEQAQVQTQWCWAATGLSIAQFLGYGRNADQNTFCNYARGLPPGQRCPNQPAYLEDVQAGWRGVGMTDVGQVTGTLSFAAVSQAIDQGSPVEVGIYWTSGGGHANVLYGYNASSQTLMYADPWPSSRRYGEMAYRSYTSNAQFRWAESLYGES
ncbi:hypothetical protein DVA86_18215 [Streptomyces armeniacus]|uniref:Peptidase C39-like domain-containing protein n=2 Tax=Streptomyces armeniacus TaxID=83291 RepID=A0A345Y0M2_9ACTN|nr:hypothetical protein DVA86_18215 [Streptomyces armeniacus]